MLATTNWPSVQPTAASDAVAVGLAPPAEAVAALEEVAVAFGGATVLEGVSLSVRRGEAVCLVGPSGGGKSTIVNLLAGLLAPTRGRVFFEGRAVDGPGPERAVVFQDAALFPWLTLEANVAFPLEIAGVAPAERRARVDELLRRVHLSRYRKAYVHELSGGMKQRGAIARALATRPRMMLFDEPFAALDAQMREILQDEVEQVVHGAGTTIVFVTHQVDEAVRLGDRVVVVGAGKLLGEYSVELPRDKDARTGTEARALAKRIGERIRAEVDLVAREEAEDGPWSTSDGGAERRRSDRPLGSRL